MSDDDESFLTPGLALRESLSEQTLPIIGAPNALAGRLISEMGFGAIYLSGAALSAGVLGLPDIGLITLPELVQQATYLTRNADVPVVVDADTGFGEAVNVERTVLELESAGVAAIQLEDQQLPKRCGHLSGKSLVEPGAMCEKIAAAAGSRYDDELVIIARTDARAVEGLEAAIERARQYVEAGAEWIFPEALTSREEFAIFAKEIDVPLVANMTEFGKSPTLTLDELTEFGYAAALYPVTLLRVAMKAMEAALAVIATEGVQTSLLEVMQTREELYELLEYDQFEKRDSELAGRRGDEGPSPTSGKGADDE